MAGKHRSFQISGEVYRVSSTTLAKLDELESHPVYYRRQEITCDVDETGETLTVNVYLLEDEDTVSHVKAALLDEDNEHFKLVDGGSWKGYLDEIGAGDGSA